MTKTDRKATTAAALAIALAGAAGCGDRADIWSQPVGAVQAYGMARSVALVDGAAHRVVALTVDGDQQLSVTRLETGRGVLATSALPDGSALYVLGAGYQPRLGDSRPFEPPTLTVISDGKDGEPPTADVIDLSGKLSDPLNGITVDPQGNWAVLYASAQGGGGFVTNPNELVIVDLHTRTITPVTLHSFGGSPERLIFTPELSLPGGSGHLLIVQSQQDLALLRLERPETKEITVRLADPGEVRRPRPAQVVVDEGDPAADDDARIGLRFEGDRNVMALQLEPSAGDIGFAPSINVADVGGVPSDIAFVNTDGGLRLAALVPTGSRAVLVDPVTTITTDVALLAPYQRLSLVAGAAGADVEVALLWQGGGAGTGVAFWELQQAAGRPFRSIETVSVTASVSGVLDVPQPNAALKVLETANTGGFYVLDLGTRTAAPLLAASSQIVLTVSRTGKRVWTFAPNGREVASTDLETKHARTLRDDTPIDAVFEIARASGQGRILLTLHATGSYGVTVYDADTADERQRRIYGALLTEGSYDDR